MLVTYLKKNGTLWQLFWNVSKALELSRFLKMENMHLKILRHESDL